MKVVQEKRQEDFLFMKKMEYLIWYIYKVYSINGEYR